MMMYLIAGLGALMGFMLLGAAFMIDSQESKQFHKRNVAKVLLFGVVWQIVAICYAFTIYVAGFFRGLEWRRVAASHCAAEGISKLMTALFFGEVVVEGLEHIPQGSIKGKCGPAIIAPNHSSMVDVLLCAMLAGDFTWVAKSTVFLVPGVGQCLYLAGTVPLSRGKKSSAMQMLEGCRKALDDGWSVLIYPQGTRDRLSWRPWKYGAFKLAIEKQVPIVPVSIILPDDTWTSGSCKLIIKAHPPVAPPKPVGPTEEMILERKEMSPELWKKMDAAIQKMTKKVESASFSAFPKDHRFRKSE
uniref:Phospholipid/glycerol acyltransferase domain-containing protein n=1 Tax=Phaeomonas parva TaxID=124430 RepID=A0A7S1XL16_9STRA|mmetsp:Transcript_17950/g.54900  ORF Transcript_17950/g.54900 Transcript_17950/m.54900 type:complete len:302 (+) Transcript_17950:165-1070(+)